MPLTAEDRMEMIELVATYNHAIDRRDAEAWADTFTEDGRFYAPPNHDVRGREALIEFIRSFGPPGGHHWTTNFEIEGDGDDATMLVESIFVRGNDVGGRGQYRNTMKRVGGKWKFAERDCLHGSTPPPMEGTATLPHASAVGDASPAEGS